MCVTSKLSKKINHRHHFSYNYLLIQVYALPQIRTRFRLVFQPNVLTPLITWICKHNVYK